MKDHTYDDAGLIERLASNQSELETVYLNLEKNNQDGDVNEIGHTILKLDGVIEKLMKQIHEDCEGKAINSGSYWQINWVTQMSKATKKRPALWSERSLSALRNIKRFRYSDKRGDERVFQNPDEVIAMANTLVRTKSMVMRDIQSFSLKIKNRMASTVSAKQNETTDSMSL
jgi:hypothetical protein